MFQMLQICRPCLKMHLSFNRDISTWNTINVTNMSSMFESATSFNQDISIWDVKNVTNMTSMFQNASIFNQNIRIWNVDDNTILNNIFVGASAIISEYTGFNGFGPPTTANFFLRIDGPLDVSNINITDFINDEIYDIEITFPIQDISENNPESDALPNSATIGDIPLTNIVRTSTGITAKLDLINNTTTGVKLLLISFKLSNNFTLNYNANFINFFTVNCLDFSSETNIVSSSINNYVFNNQLSYNSHIKYGLFDGTYKILNVPESHPIAILNQNIAYSPENTTPYIIKVSGGNTTPTNGDYFTFTDINDNSLQIGNGLFKFMYLRTYRFADYGISSSHPFKLSNSPSSISGGSNGSIFLILLLQQIFTINV